MKELFATERGGQKLTALVAELLADHYLESIQIDDVSGVVMDEVLESAGEAWEEAYGRALPKVRAREIESWAAAKRMGAETKPKSKTVAKPPSPVLHLAAGMGASEADLFGDKGPTDRERAQLDDDEKSQGLTGEQIVQLAIAIELGSIPVLGDVLGVVRYGSDPRLCEQVRKAKKGGIATLQSILGNTGGSVVRELTSHFSNLIREYSQDGEVLQASNLNSWWSETQQVAASPKMLVEYIKEYFRKYSGRGLPVTVDVLIATRCASSLGGDGGVSKEELKEIRDIAKSAKAETAAVKNELNQVKAELNRLKNNGASPPGGGGKDANIKCNSCGKTGHRWANCPTRLVAEAEGKSNEAAKDE